VSVPPVSRRAILQAGIGLAGAAALAPTRLRAADASPSPTPTPPPPTLGPTQPPIELPTPPIIRSEAGVLSTTLTAMPATVEMNAGGPVTTWTYDGLVPAPTWEIQPGDVLRVQVINELPPLEHSDHPVDLTRPHEWTTTNLHTHGLHVSPVGNADNPFVQIAPGETFDYEIAVPDDHSAGFYWYHPHKHGGVAQQVRAGMAGAIIVRGDLDEVPEVKAAQEQVLILQAIELGDDLQLLDPIPYPSKQEAFIPRTTVLYTVNGVMNPVVRMYPGQVARWRLLNAAEGKFQSVRLTGHDVHVLAWDGLTLAAPEPAQDLMMSAGNRVEVLVKAGEPGTYHLMLSPGSSQHPDVPGMTGMQHEQPVTKELLVRPIMTLIVEGSGPEMALPTALPAFDPPMLPIVNKRVFSYTVERTEDLEFLDFGVNGESFDPVRPPYQVTLDTAEEWTLVNDADAKLPEHAHVFHIHVNPFLVTHINGEKLDKPLWRDTFVLSGNDGDSITFVSNFTDFTGRSVHHCHVLAHEDLGMMEMFEVVS
jgi:FtsP/CotA-like multicopper oxidase with cupredoxin domain